MAKLTSKRNKKKVLTAEEQEKALEKMSGEKRGKYYGRVTVDFPHEVYDEMKEFVEEDGRTLKGYIVGLVKKNLKNKG